MQYLTIFVGDQKQEKEFVDQYLTFFNNVQKLGNIYGEYFLDFGKNIKKLFHNRLAGPVNFPKEPENQICLNDKVSTETSKIPLYEVEQLIN